MNWQFIVAFVIAVPIIVLPAVFVWYLNVDGIYSALKEARKKRVQLQFANKQARPE